MTPVTHSPISIIFGKFRTGSLVSSAMFTESSKPTIAKNANDVAAVTATKGLLPSAGAISPAAEKSASPKPRAYRPIRMMISRPESSMQGRRSP